MFCENAERSDVTWGQLAFYTESLGTLQRCNPKVSLLIKIVALFSMMTIIVAFLTRLSGFQTITNNANLLFFFLDHIRSKELSVVAAARPHSKESRLEIQKSAGRRRGTRH